MGPTEPFGRHIRRNPVRRMPPAILVSGPAGRFSPCPEHGFGCPGIRNSKFQWRHPAREDRACQQFGIPNSICRVSWRRGRVPWRLSGSAAPVGRNVEAQWEREGNTGSRTIFAGLSSCRPMRNVYGSAMPTGETECGAWADVRQGGTIRSRVPCRRERCPARLSAMSGTRCGSAADGRREAHPLQETSPPQGLDAAKIVIQPSRRTPNRHPVQNGCTSRPSGGT